MNPWAWVLIPLLLLQIVGPLVSVGKPRPPLRGSVAAVLTVVAMGEMFAVLKLAGAL
jgi:hypothetical protein